MKAALETYCWRGFRMALRLMLLSLPALSPAEESFKIASVRPLLEQALNQGTIVDGDLSLLEAGLRCELLVQFGRMLPAGMSGEEKKALATVLLRAEAGDRETLEKRVSRFPAADELVFDGRSYSGGNLSYIDSILGKSGRPIAFDRELPALLVPLEQEAETYLLEKRNAYLKDDGSQMARQLTDAAQGAGSAGLMFADGQFLRPYAGRFDDLYFHLFQNGNGASALAFCALVEGLGRRTYQPVSGVCVRASVPVKGVDLDEILSDGGKTAVHRYLRTQAADAPEPFQGFAFRILPGIVGKVAKLPPGGRFTATNSEILRAFRTQQHLYPLRVPPLYRSPNRFLGWSGSLLRFVANRVTVPAGVADSWYPLPGRAAQSADESAVDGASSAQLFDPSDSSIAPPEIAVQSSSAGDVIWEDPVESKLLADPGVSETSGQVEVRPALPVDPPAGSPKTFNDPRLKPTATRLIAVVMPTVDEAKTYHAALAANDAELRAVEQAKGRARLLRQSLVTAEKAIKNGTGAAALSQALASDLAWLDAREQQMADRFRTALDERHDLRGQLEQQLQDERIPLLHPPVRKGEPAAVARDGLLL